MTREEAITILGDYEYILFEDEDTYNREAFRMAIQALSQEPTKEEQALLQKWRDNRGISIEEFEDAMNTLQEPCDDAISREELLKAIDTWDKFGVDDTNSLFRLDNLSLPHYVPYIHYDDVIKCIKGMPPVTPSRRKGHWIKGEEWCETVDGFERWGNDYTCSECGLPLGRYTLTDYCPNCGARMESEDKE